ncbi:MAG: NADH-quinone oxidoreductase subunit NuoG [Anaerolineae bacterium]|nr:NADH-quinone oxidoreductase subunit NuoG [Anaerolineae bacterium]
MADLVNLTIDGVPVSVPKGTLVVDAAKKIGNDIPVFCYHPKLKPVGMCRMCLVDIGTPKIDPATKQPVRDEQGNVVIVFMPKLTTACTTPVSEGMVVRTATEQVRAAREDILEFLLTSHPLDCPICDKGGECPLQNLTLGFGPGVSRFDYDAKFHNEKHVPLGDLIYLDRERCIQCSRCIRFQDEIADDHVLQFYDRGRGMEIITLSDPPFDSYFGGNTTDICPVGALTTADFRFKARPWELASTQSLCTHCPVGCNITLNTRLETKTGGYEIKRVMPRQNEQVNEIWICDKGRYVHHFTRAEDRLRHPLIRRDGRWVEATWEQALQLVGDRLKAAGAHVAAVVGDRIANEDAYLVAKLMRALNGAVGMSPSVPAYYADVVRAFGVAAQTDFARLGKGDVILVVNGDVEEQAPVWFLRLRQAVVDRGAALVMAHARSTKMHRYARAIYRYEPGRAAQWIAERSEELIAKDLKDARNLLIVFGDEQLDGPGARALAQSLANILIATGHAGKAESGLLALYPHANTQGVFDMTVGSGSAAASHGANGKFDPDVRREVAWLIGVGEAGDVPEADFVIVQELFMTEIARRADVVLPALSFAEREGTFTSGDRRVQRFYRALPPLGEAKPDWWIAQEIAKRLGHSWSFQSPQHIFADLARNIPHYGELSYDAISKSEPQWPPMGRDDLYYGGTVYDNTGGLGVRYACDAERDPSVVRPYEVVVPEPTIAGLERGARPLYRDGELIRRSAVLAAHIVPRQAIA